MERHACCVSGPNARSAASEVHDQAVIIAGQIPGHGSRCRSGSAAAETAEGLRCGAAQIQGRVVKQRDQGGGRGCPGWTDIRQNPGCQAPISLRPAAQVFGELRRGRRRLLLENVEQGIFKTAAARGDEERNNLRSHLNQGSRRVVGDQRRRIALALRRRTIVRAQSLVNGRKGCCTELGQRCRSVLPDRLVRIDQGLDQLGRRRLGRDAEFTDCHGGMPAHIGIRVLQSRDQRRHRLLWVGPDRLQGVGRTSLDVLVGRSQLGQPALKRMVVGQRLSRPIGCDEKRQSPDQADQLSGNHGHLLAKSNRQCVQS